MEKERERNGTRGRIRGRQVSDICLEIWMG